MNNKADDEPKGPSVESDNQEERILARRLRIQRRQEMLKRAQLGEADEDNKATEQEQTVSQKQMEESYTLLRKLHEDGFEMVTNIRVATDAREVARRIEEEEGLRQRKEKLEAEAKAAAERFEEITKKWEVALQKEIPQDLHEMLNQQKMACDAMLDEKNKLITDYQAELKAKDDQYVRDLKKQAEDIDLLIERMESQVKELTKSYQRELQEIEKAFVLERSEMLEHHSEKWNQMLQERRQKEIDYMEKREKRVEDFEQQLQALRIQDAEEYNQVKIKLETDVQILQQQLQQMKATYQLNQEKLEYNFQVLRKRDEENQITKSQQKRKITRLHDVLTNLKHKLAKQEKAYVDDNQQLTADYRHLLDQFKDVQRKAKTFMGADAKKFNEIWLMNEEEAKRQARYVLEADRIIHEQQLGLPWSPSDLEFMNNMGPVTSQRDRGRSASAKRLAQQVLNAVNENQDPDQPQVQQQGQQTELWSGSESGAREIPVSSAQVLGNDPSMAALIGQFSPNLVKQILELLCDESGFLVESKLMTLLAPLQPCEQTLMKLDAIFSALGVESEEDIEMLSRYFVKFQVMEPAQLHDDAAADYPPAGNTDELDSDEQAADRLPTPDANALPAPSSDTDAFTLDGERDRAATHVVDRTASPEAARSQVSRASDRVASASDEGRRSKQSTADIVESDQKTAAHPQMINPNDVLMALRAFVEETNKRRPIDAMESTVGFHFQLPPGNALDSPMPQGFKALKASAPAAHSRQASVHAAKQKQETPVIVAANDSVGSVAAVKRDVQPISEIQKLLFEKSQMASQFTIVNVNKRDDSEDAAYWAKYKHVIPKETEKVWDALLMSFEKHYEVLTARAKLIEETDGLQQQNGELRLLLHQYVSSKVNQELQIPPTSVYQFNRIM